MFWLDNPAFFRAKAYIAGKQPGQESHIFRLITTTTCKKVAQHSRVRQPTSSGMTQDNYNPSVRDVSGIKYETRICARKVLQKQLTWQRRKKEAN